MDEDNIFNFYHVVFMDEMEFFGISPAKIKGSFSRLNRTYNRKALRNGKAYVNYHLAPDRCAYLFKFGPCHTQLVLEYFNNFLKSHPHAYSILEKKDKLKICCLGGGPGIEVVGMFLALEAYENLWMKLSDVTVLDVCGGWRNSFQRVMKQLKTVFPVHENLATSLLQVDLMTVLSAPARKAIEEADIICMMKFVSTVISDSSAEVALKEIANHMKNGAIVFFIDNVDRSIHKPLGKYLKESGLKCVFSICCSNFKVKGTYPLNFIQWVDGEAMESASAYVMGWIKQFCPLPANSLHRETYKPPCIYKRNYENNYQKVDAYDSDPEDEYEETDENNSLSVYDDDDDDDAIQNCKGESNNFSYKESSCNVSAAKLYSDQCTQTVNCLTQVSDHSVGHNSHYSSFSSDVLPCIPYGPESFLDHCTHSPRNCQCQLSSCTHNSQYEHIANQLSAVSRHLKYIEFTAIVAGVGLIVVVLKYIEFIATVAGVGLIVVAIKELMR